ncbi:PP2C family protein-serine/threonine phosphatase [Selenihalanaerobacter shriftii]|uniref:Serine/threonine protein phosphatase PrpC n=1 Tax=Selenihalanaerobacter shriftii TaxID=142842 RepID=A0A1T4Q1D7_9FIRM|nr:PP2C family serine/threonine-protein phosphatase [Selenihalanaerobacter shriftii]SJZ97593.1 Serine/threonine protein phosphatase PrpC [Selenihalanaerobacter shriftii]
MRKDNSELLTKFISKPGNFKKNRDYFAYAEHDDMACWVLADGLDSAPDVLSAEIVVGSILNDFTENPSMKKRHIKKYIRNANQALLHESRMMNLQSAVLVVITDYNSIIWGNVGNTRLYHLRKGRINLKSKDHSLAQMMVDAGELEDRQINHHQERNNLTDYLGQRDKIKPYVSKKHTLKDDDFLLMCTSGFWENLEDKEIGAAAKEATEAQGFIEELEGIMLNKDNDNLDNYSMVSVFAKKVFKEEKNSRKNLYKKAAVILIPIFMLTGGFIVYRKIRAASNLKRQKQLILRKIKQATTRSRSADKLARKGNSRQALAEYKKSKETYRKHGKKEKVAEIDKKMKRTETIILGEKIEKEADKQFDEAKYERALTKYEAAKLKYLKVDDYDLNNIEEKIAKTENILKAISYEEEGNMFFKSNQFSVSKEKYTAALDIYSKYELANKKERINQKIEKSQQLMNSNQRVVRARKVESSGDELFKMRDFKSATLKYTEAKVIYSELGMSRKVSKLEEKINSISSSKAYIEAKEYENQADVQLEKSKYTEALFGFKQANKIYSRIGKDRDCTRIEKKIEDSKKIIKAQKAEAEGDELLKMQNFENASLRYMEAKVIYAEMDMEDDMEMIQQKITNVSTAKLYKEAKEYEGLADMQFDNEKYKEALFNYKQANKMYGKVSKGKDYARVREKIQKTEEEKEKFLFFF